MRSVSRRSLRAALAVAAAVALAAGCGAPEPAPAPPEPAPPEEVPAAPPPEAPAPPAPRPSEPAPEAPAPDSPSLQSPAPPPLDLDELEQRLKDTPAIGVFTKLALRNDIDDLLAALRAYHESGQGSLASLRERFDLLAMKVMSLLQDDDPDLADAVARSRERLWKLLADPTAFARLTA